MVFIRKLYDLVGVGVIEGGVEGGGEGGVGGGGGVR